MFQEWMHQSFKSCSFHILGTKEQVSPQESKDFVGLSANIVIGIPFQIICNCYTEIFDTFSIFQLFLNGIGSLDFISQRFRQVHHVAFDRLTSQIKKIY